MFKEEDFDQIRPYYDHEVYDVVKRILASPVFDKILNYLSEYQDTSKIKPILKQARTVRDFQFNLMYPLVAEIIKHTTDGFTTSGTHYIKPGMPYLFLSNHRDIVLDAAILQYLLFEIDCGTSEITFGSNLMTSQFIIDFGKINRMFVVNRGGNGRELFKNAQLLSAYIRHTITKKKVSVWIAQRNGRTKDGNDKTEPGLLKMFNISGARNFIESFKELNIVPLSVSYEIEPCCALKIKEISVRSQGIPYHKKSSEDITSIITGITQQKGRVHFSLCKPLNLLMGEIDNLRSNNEKINRLTTLIDREIHSNYKLWPNNYIAYDMLYNTEEFSDYYTNTDKKKFFNYMEQELKSLDIDEAFKRELLLKIYANPVVNAKKSLK